MLNRFITYNKNLVKHISSLPAHKKNEYAGGCFGIMAGLYVNNIRIKHANYYVVKSRDNVEMEKQMPKYPLHLWAISNGFFSGIGYLVGSVAGFTIMLPSVVIGHIVGTYAESSVEYDRACEQKYFEIKNKDIR